MSRGLEARITTQLHRAVDDGGFAFAMVLDESGLPLAQAGDADAEVLGSVVSLLDEVLMRSQRDLGMDTVDEVTVRDARKRLRLVIRPISEVSGERLLLLVGVHGTGTWRRVTTGLCASLGELFGGERWGA